MDKVKVYRRTGRVFLSIWVITWALLICQYSIPYTDFNNFMSNIFSATILNLAFNPSAFIGAVLLDLVALKEHPSRKHGWFKLVALYLILWVGLFIFVFQNCSSHRLTIVDMRMIEKPIVNNEAR